MYPSPLRDIQTDTPCMWDAVRRVRRSVSRVLEERRALPRTRIPADFQVCKKAARALAKSKASPPKRAPLHARLPSHSFARASIFLGLLLHSRLECPLYGCWVSAPVASPAGTFRVWRSAVSDAGIAIFIKNLRSKHCLLNSHCSPRLLFAPMSTIHTPRSPLDPYRLNCRNHPALNALQWHPVLSHPEGVHKASTLGGQSYHALR